MTNSAPYWQQDKENVALSLGTSLSSGLSEQAAKLQFEKFGPNQLSEKQAIRPVEIFLDQFRDFIIWVLVGAALVSGFLREWVDAFAILAIVILNAIMGFVQEYRAEKSLAALKKLSSPSSKVIRGGETKTLASLALVPGDLIELESGDMIPADSRLVWTSANFSVLEASLTGESTPAAKTSHALQESEIPLGDRANMVYMGTAVAEGKARAVIVETGMRTELGKIARAVQSIERETTPLQKKLEEFGKWIVYLCFILVAVIFVMEWLRGRNFAEVFLTAVSLAVAAIPEGLPAVVTIALALGVNRMVKRHALIRKLPSVETLGSATVICSDKTGTLTKNEMTVQKIFSGGKYFDVTGIGYEPKGGFFQADRPLTPEEDGGLRKVLQCAVLCNGAQLRQDEGHFRIFGDPTEGALLTAAAKGGLWKERLEEEFPFADEIPFDPVRKKMTILRKRGPGITAFVKGAPDVLVDDCSLFEENGEVKGLTEQDRVKIRQINDELAGQAMRVLAVAYRDLERRDKYEASDVEQNLIFVGLVAMIDPPREEVRAAIQECKTAGIKTVMITGDHIQTAVAIAKALKIFEGDSQALTAQELDRLSDEEFFAKVRNISVYARVSPEHKLRVVKAWRRHGDIVAMTGDGVNDAPAVKEADIGVAMGITGTDVTKEVSDMVVTDDNFASIVSAVEEGRGIYDNIKKFVHYLLSCNAGEILLMFVASLLALPAPLLAIHILWINLVTDGIPALALGVDPISPGIMKRPPRKTGERVVTRPMALLMLLQGSFIALSSLAAFLFVLFVEKESVERARTAAFIVLGCSQLFHAFNCRNMKDSLFKIGFLTNKNLILAVFVSFAMLMAVVYVPFLQRVFKTVPLALFDWLFVIILSSLTFWGMELWKYLACRKHYPINREACS
ncbi:MAG: calcium-translocating P-type ATPase, SERCA-type [Candidatus Omnitrophota bacterium]